MFRTPTNDRHSLRAAIVACVVFVLGAGAVLALTLRARSEHHALLTAETATAAESVSQSLELAVSNLSAINGLFLADAEVEPDAFERFASSLDLRRNPNTVAVARRISADELTVTTTRLREWYGVEPYELIRELPSPIGARGEYYIVTHQFGLGEGESIVGLDFASVRARSGLIAAVERTKLPRFGEVTTLLGLGTKGFPVAVPMIDGAGDVVGITMAAAEVGPLLDDAIAAPIEAHVSFELTDVTQHRPVISESIEVAAIELNLGGRYWRLTGHTRQPFSHGPYLLALALVGLAAIGTGFLTRHLLVNRHTQARLQRVEAEHQANLEYQAALERFEVLASNATDAVTRNTLSGICLYASPSTERIIGSPPEELEGRSVFSLIHPDDRAHVVESHDAMVSGSADTITVEYRIVGADGRPRWIESVSRLVVGVAGVEVQASSRDITERVQQREELRQARLQAEAAGEAKAQFIANISHEIRTPLNAIAAMTDMALASDLTGSQREYLQVVKSSAQALMAIVNDVLDLSKAASGQMTLHEEGFATRDLFTTVIRSFEADATKRDLELILAYDDQLPDWLWGDPGRIRQILINLIGNALKFTHAGGVTVKVTRPTSGGIRCDISDTGIGIPADRLEAIFDDFTQAEGTTTQNYGGTGLGLGISRRLTELMSGRIWVTSTLGEGSTFTFELPLEAWEPPADSDEARPFVDVVTSDPDGTNSVATLLGVGGRSARRVSPGEIRNDGGALIALVEGPDDPVGVQACRASSRVLVIDAAPERGNSDHFRRLGAAAYIGRPAEAMDVLDLLDAIESDRHGFLTRHDLRERRQVRHVLVADDVATNRLVVEQLLGKRGHVVTSVADGRQAVEAMEVERYDIVLMDVQMPVLDGLEATRLIREHEAARGWHTPIIALTGRAMDGDREAAIDAGCDGYMTKPFDPHLLCVTVEDLSAEQADSVEPTDQATGPIDMSTLDAHSGGDVEILTTLLETARQESADQRRLLNTDETDAIAGAAHKLKGMLGMIGAADASAAAAALEEAARREQREAIPDLMEDLDSALIVLSSAIDDLLGRSEPSDALA